jgi:uncharacterized membrane protein YeaQ/YmgE (transglycosylase-associated protein family)
MMTPLIGSDPSPLFSVESGLLMGIALMFGAGLVVGVLAGWFGSRDDRSRWFPNLAVGGAGGLAAGLLGRTLGVYNVGSTVSIAASVLGAAALILLYRAINRASMAGA